MGTIKIHRTKEFTNMMRNYQILIDGQLVGTIANGETKDFPVTAGSHTVKAKIDWCGSSDISITLGENETKEFKLQGLSFLASLFALYYITIARDKYLALTEI